MEEKILNVGDVVYSYHFGVINSRYSIDRVTAKFAFSNGIKFRRQINQGGCVWDTSNKMYNISTPKMDEEFECKNLISSIRRIFDKIRKPNDISLEDARDVYGIIKKYEDK